METTLLITTYNRADLLARSLERLVQLTPPTEVLVIDDGGTDNTREVCDRHMVHLGAPAGSLPIRYIHNNNPGDTNCCLARNIGIREARAEWIVTSEPEVYFLSDVFARLEKWEDTNDVVSPAVCFHGRVGQSIPDPGRCDVVAPGFYLNLWRKTWLEEVHGWDEEMPGPWGWDDIDLFTRLRTRGHDRIEDPGLAILHQWHPSRIEPATGNEAQFRRKHIANMHHHWGRLRSE